MKDGETMLSARIPEELKRQVMMKCVSEGTSVQAVVRQLLAEWVKPEPKRKKKT